MQDHSTPSASSSQPAKKRGRPSKQDTQGPSPSPKAPEPKKKRNKSKGKDPKPGVYLQGMWHLGTDGNAYDIDGKIIEAPGKKYFFQNERGTMAKKGEATRVSLVPDTKALLGGATLKKTDKRSKTAKPKKSQSKSNFDRDTRRWISRAHCRGTRPR